LKNYSAPKAPVQAAGACGGSFPSHSLKNKKEKKIKKLLKKIVQSNQVPGIIAYYKGEPVGWCAIEPRETFKRLETSRILKPVDDKHVWSIVCFYIKKEYRRKGVSKALIKAAVDYAKKKKAKVIEGYPLDLSKKENYPDAFAYHGSMSSFKAEGFKEVLRRSETRPIMRYYI
jgi:GNAT superfamily N-acetyltransferase